MEREQVVASVVAAAGGRLTGRVRLQKVIYILDQLGLNSGFNYEYHHYGPYSRELDSATADAKEFLGLKEDFEHRDSDGARYSVFSYSGVVAAEAYGDLSQENAGSLLKIFSATNITVLELAPTIDWLWRVENISDWRSEVANRKSVKVQGGRLERAVALLEKLGVPPPVIDRSDRNRSATHS